MCRQRLGAGPSFCSFCNIPGHTFDNCRKRYGPCIHCGRTGHQSTECFSLKKRGHSEYDGPATQRAAFKKFKGQKERPHEEKRANVRRSPCNQLSSSIYLFIHFLVAPFPSRILLNIMSNLTLQDILTLRLVAHPLSILTFQTLYAHHSINFNRLWIKICTHGSLGQFTALINEFPNIDLLTQDDCACYRAAVTGNIPIVKRIHELAAVDQATQRAIVQSNDYEPLRIAAVCGRLTILRLIYEYCSLEDRRASRFHLPTIKEVVVRGHGEVLKQLFMWCDEGEQMGMLRVCLGLAVELGNGEIAGWGLKEGLRMGLKISLKVEDEVKEELPDELVEISDDGNEDCK